MDASVTRTSDDQSVLNTLVIPAFPVRFQIAGGDAAGLGIANAPFTMTSNGQPVPTDATTTDANGEVRIPLFLLISGQVVVHIFDTDYTFSLKTLEPIKGLVGQQQRLDQLGYMTGYQLDFLRQEPPDDNKDGPRTEQAIMNFQSDNNLFLDGVIGKNTTAALKKASRL